METTVVTIKGQIVIPVTLRRKLKLSKGSKVVISERENGLFLQPLNEDYFKNQAGVLPTKGKAIKTLLESRKAERKRENNRTR